MSLVWFFSRMSTMGCVLLGLATNTWRRNRRGQNSRFKRQRLEFLCKNNDKKTLLHESQWEHSSKTSWYGLKCYSICMFLRVSCKIFFPSTYFCKLSGADFIWNSTREKKDEEKRLRSALTKERSQEKIRFSPAETTIDFLFEAGLKTKIIGNQ